MLHRSGDADGAARELRIAEEQDPELFQSARPRESTAWLDGHFSFMGGSGVEFDTNPTIEGEEGSTPSNGDDFRLVYNAAIATQLVRTEASALSRATASTGAATTSSSELDLTAHGLGLGGVHAFENGAFARLDGGAGFQRIEHDDYLDTLSLAPTLGFSLGERGVLQLRAVAEQRDFAAEPAAADASLERDGWRYAAALSHTLPLERWPGAYLVTQLQYARSLTHGGTDANGFGWRSTRTGSRPMRRSRFRSDSASAWSRGCSSATSASTRRTRCSTPPTAAAPRVACAAATRWSTPALASSGR